MRDALRLSRAMTFKSAAAGLPLGGGKGVIMLRAEDPPLDADRRRDALLDFGDAVEALGGSYVTAEDVGTSDGDMTVIAERTSHVAGLAVERGGSGDPSPWTALGVEAAIRVTCEAVWGTADLAGRTIAVIGLGHVGGALARGLAEGGASLLLADVVAEKRALADELGAAWAEPGEALRADVDLVAPCALGGVLDDESVPELRCRAIAGAANNQLATDADRRARSTPAGSSGRPTSSPTRAGSSTSPSSSSPRATTPAAPASASSPSATPSAPCSRPPSATASRRSPRRWRSPASGSPDADRRGAPRRPQRRPSSRSLSRWAWSVHVAGSSSPGGIASQAPASSSSSVRAPASQAARMRRSRSSRWATYSSSFAAGSSTTGPWPG